MSSGPWKSKPPRPADSQWMTVRDAAAYLRVSPRAIYAACRDGGLPHMKLGHSTLRLRKDWIDQWAEQRRAS